MTRSISARLAALEAGDGNPLPIVAFPDRVGAEPRAFYIAGVRHECDEGEAFAAAAHRVAARLRPGARVILWPLPMCALDRA